MPPVRLTLRQAPYNRLLRHPEGDVGRYIYGRLLAVEIAAKQRCPVDEGELRASSRVEVLPGLRGPRGTLTFSAEHAVFVHEGTKPHWPPIRALEKWAKRHGFPNAFLVARAIAMKGTKGVPFLWDGLVFVIVRAQRRHPSG